jgi:hypothetical protein
VTREDFLLFKYCRLLQSIPTSPLIGRRMSWLVFDVAVEPKRLLGAFGLNSSPFSLGARDRYLGWSASGATAAKERGLLCLMDMPICMALQPYAEFRGAKLVAALALTDEVNRRYSERYKGRLPKGGGLLGVVTLCATGVHCPIYNRILLRPGGLYRRIGLTRGFSTAFVSDPTLALARRVVQTFGSGLKRGLFAKSMRLVKRALELSGIPGEPLLHTGVRKGIYFGTGDARAVEMLRTSAYGALIVRPTVSAVIESWKSSLRKRRHIAGVGGS